MNTASLKQDYQERIVPILMKEFNYTTVMQCPKLTKKINLQLVNEQKERMKALWNYKSSEAFQGTNSKTRVDEETKFGDLVNKARKLMK